MIIMLKSSLMSSHRGNIKLMLKKVLHPLYFITNGSNKMYELMNSSKKKMGGKKTYETVKSLRYDCGFQE